MKNFKIIFAILITITFLSSCRKDTISRDIERTPITPQVNVEATINGFITDLNGEAIPDATVSITNNMTQTNELGFFEITGLVNEKYGVIEVEKPGYFKQYETIVPTRTATNRVRIKMMERSLASIIPASTGGIVSIGSNSKVEFQPNSFIDSDGNPYNGNIYVYTHYIDPTHEDIDQIMPGNLLASNSNDEINILQSFGMINVELQRNNGQKLNINKPATITVDVPQSITNNAPTEIPLWYFDEASGLWIEEGNATLSNGQYIGEVNHFTFWNCDVPFDVTFVNGQIVDPEGVSIARVRITDLSTGTSFTEWTDSEGFFSGGVPQNVNLLLEVLGFCGNDVIFSTNIGPFSADQVDLGAFTLTNNGSYTLITGTLTNCDQSPLSNGQVYFNIANQPIVQQTSTDPSGNFSAYVPSCSMDEIEIRAMDLSNGFISQPLNVMSSNTPIEVGSITVCTNISGSLGSIVIDYAGGQKVFDNCKVKKIISVTGDTTSYSFTYADYSTITNDTTVLYILPLIDGNSDLSNPDWFGSFFSWTGTTGAAADLPFFYEPRLIIPGFTVTVDQEATNPGNIMELTIENAFVKKETYNLPNGPITSTDYPNSTITIKAVLQ